MEEKELQVIEVEASGKSMWSGGAYTIAFLYTKHKGNLIVKGYREEVQNYIEANFTHYFVNYTMYGGYNSRNYWKFWKSGIYISEPDRKRNKGIKPKYKWRVHDFNTINLSFRRLPKHWIKEFDNL